MSYYEVKMAAAQLNLEMERGADWDLPLTLYEPDEVTITDLTGCTAVAEVHAGTTAKPGVVELRMDTTNGRITVFPGQVSPNLTLTVTKADLVAYLKYGNTRTFSHWVYTRSKLTVAILFFTLGAVRLASDVITQGGGYLNATLGPVNLTGVASTLVQGAAAANLGATTLDASGSVVDAATAVVTLGSLGTSAQGQSSVVGTMTIALGDLVATSQGQVYVTGSLGRTLGSLTLTADGSVYTPGPYTAPSAMVVDWGFLAL